LVAAVHAVSVPGLASFGMIAIRAFGDVNVPIHEFSAIWAIAHRGIGAAVIEVGTVCPRGVHFGSQPLFSCRRPGRCNCHFPSLAGRLSPVSSNPSQAPTNWS
jgi:hypothetical protein